MVIHKHMSTEIIRDTLHKMLVLKKDTEEVMHKEVLDKGVKEEVFGGRED